MNGDYLGSHHFLFNFAKSRLFMFKILGLFSLLVISMIACQENKNILLQDANQILSADSVELFKYKIIRLTGKLPGKADHTTKFDTIFDEHYKNLSQQHDLVYYIPSQNDKNSIQFLLTRIAPSLHEKKVAIAGKVTFDITGNIIYYEEVFRTWKMLVPELKEKSDLLFRLYLGGKDLSPYYTTNSKGVEYIEFPNEHVRFDPAKKQWVSDLEDPLEPYYDMKR